MSTDWGRWQEEQEYWAARRGHDGPASESAVLPVILIFRGVGRLDVQRAIGICLLAAPSAQVVDRADDVTISIPERAAVVVLRRLTDDAIVPAKVLLRQSELMPAQIESIRSIVGPTVTIELTNAALSDE